jgi:predicted enzyme involved in methoxymalonyl-ACP biosynthesis
MSCRILGRNIEMAFVHALFAYFKEKGFKKVTADYYPTKKNGQVSDFYSRAGMQLVEETAEAKTYSLSLSEFKPVGFDYILTHRHF